MHTDDPGIRVTDRHRVSGGNADEDILMGYVIGYVAIFSFCVGVIAGYLAERMQRK